MPLDRDAVLRAGLAIADAEGPDALTVRNVARQLGVTPMALYNHIGGREDLLGGVADLIAREIRRPSRRWGWRRRLRTLMTSTRDVCLAHPGAAPLLQAAKALTPGLLQPTESALEALGEAGLTAERAAAGWAALIGLTFGHVSYQLAGHMKGPSSGTGAFDADAYPQIAEIAAAPPFDWDRAFNEALDALIDGLIAPSRRASP